MVDKWQNLGYFVFGECNILNGIRQTPARGYRCVGRMSTWEKTIARRVKISMGPKIGMCENKDRFRGLSRAIRLSFLVVASLAFVSCTKPTSIGPLVAGPRHCGVGIYEIKDTLMTPAVRYFKVEGFGLIVVDNKLCLGYTDYEIAHAEVEQQSYRLKTPIADFAIGKEAEDLNIGMLKGQRNNYR